MDLSCSEPSNKIIRAVEDNVILRDDRVLHQLLDEEIMYIPILDYFDKVQTEIQPYMRKIVTTWMLEVCEEQKCEDQVLPLAVNYMDRFLCFCNIKKQQLQLLGATCLLIASKLRTSNYLPVDLLCAYTDYSISFDLITNWEQLVVTKLNYLLTGITGYDYIDQIIQRFDWGDHTELLRKHSNTLVSICATEPAFIVTPASTIAGACLGSAIRGLSLPYQVTAIRNVCKLLNLDEEANDNMITLVDGIVTNVTSTADNEPPASHELSGYESPTYVQPETPTDVEVVYF